MTSAVAPEPVIRAQPGPQRAFLSTPADVAIMGGSVYGGKTWSLIVAPLRHVHTPGFTFVAFRRLVPMIRNPGGMWDESLKWYPMLDGEATNNRLEWTFPSTAWGKFSGLQYDNDVLDWKGSQICLVLFDQLEEFTEHQFFYILSRNRSTCGVRPYCRASANPDPDSFLAKLLTWWIDPDSGYAIPERSAVVRWMLRVDDVVQWASVEWVKGSRPFLEADAEARAEFLALHGPKVAGQSGAFVKSFTFVLARLQDNRIGLDLDPGYEANVRMLPHVEQERLLGGDRGGNWKIRAAAGLVFNRAWFEIVDAAPADTRWIRAWDKAYTAGGGDWTSGTKIGHSETSRMFYVGDNIRAQVAAHDRENLIRQTAEIDGAACAVWVWQDPAAGKDSVNTTIQNLAGFDVRAEPARRDKLTNANPMAAQAQAGNVKLLRGAWNDAYLRYLHAFPTKGVPDDDVDSSSLAFLKLTNTNDAWIDFAREEIAERKRQQEQRSA